MRIDILTLFPDMFTALHESILGRAVKGGKIEINIHDIREYTLNKHKKVDDYPFGGGAGMVLTPQPVADCIKAVDPNHEARRIYMSPKGRTFNQKMVNEYLGYDRLLLLCGHYEGIDQRVLDLFIDEEQEQKEKKLQETIISIKKKFGKNAIIKGMNLEEKATTISRNKLIGGHNEE